MKQKSTQLISNREIKNALGELKELKNTLSDLVPSGAYLPEQINNLETLFINNRYQPLTQQRNLLSFLYSEHGIVQTAVDQPVEDAFRGGVDIESKEMDADDIAELQEDMENTGSIERLKEAEIWKRLFGGGGLIINMRADPAQPFNNEPSKDLEFYAVDRWELTNARGSEHYLFYGKKIHRSRVIELSGKNPPSFIRPQLQGWGQSEIERMVRDINAYFKNKDVIFELLDEAKVDVYGIKGFNANLATAKGTTQIQRRIQLGNQMKNYNNAVVMDKEDVYEQKTLTFAGLSDMLKETRIGIASALKMPMSKLFGIGAAGFSSGEDDIEVYNSMVESEIRSKIRMPLKTVIGLHCMKLWGYIPKFDAKFKPLRMMSEEQEENIKRSRQTRVMEWYDRGLTTAEETGQSARAYELLPVKTGFEDGDLLPAPPQRPGSQMGPGEEGQAGEGGAPAGNAGKVKKGGAQ